MQTALSVEEARARILAAIHPVGPEQLCLDAACGRVLTREVCALQPSPPFTNSAMDGYAFRWDEVSPGCELPVQGTQLAGPAEPQTLLPGHARKVMTGAPVPAGADTVVRREDTEERPESVVLQVLPSAGRGANVRYKGESFAAGEVLLAAGTRLNAAAISLAASQGCAVLHVRRAPRVAVISTGDELVELGNQPGFGQIINSSAHAVASLIRQAGGSARILPIAPDQAAGCRDIFLSAVEDADMLVSLGGVSMGDADIVRDVVAELAGGRVDFWKVRIKPGKPLAFGEVGAPSGRRAVFFGLPGNPLSSIVTFYQFVRPALLKAQGLTELLLPRLTARLLAPARGPRGRRAYLVGRLAWQAGEAVFRPHTDQSSGGLLAAAHSNALGIVEEGVGSLEAGQEISVESLPLATAVC